LVKNHIKNRNKRSNRYGIDEKVDYPELNTLF